MVLIDGNGIPLGSIISTASRNDVRLIEGLIDNRTFRRKVKRLIYDKAADSDPLRSRLKKRGTELITPHQKGRKNAPRKTDESSADTVAAGKLNAPLRGSKTFDVLSPDLNSTPTCSMDLLNSLA